MAQNSSREKASCITTSAPSGVVTVRSASYSVSWAVGLSTATSSSARRCMLSANESTTRNAAAITVPKMM